MSVTLAQITSQSLKIIIGVAPHFEGVDSCVSLRIHLAKTRENWIWQTAVSADYYTFFLLNFMYERTI